MKRIELPPRGLETLFGVHDQNIKYLESLLSVRIDARGQDVSIDGDPADVETVERILQDFSDLFKEGNHFTDKELREAFAQIAEDRAFSLRDYFTKARFNPAGKKQVAPKSANQRKYIQAIQEKDVVFGIGVAGTGKTYLAVAMAVQSLMQKQVNRIVLARPAVEAGEKLGFLPGDLQAGSAGLRAWPRRVAVAAAGDPVCAVRRLGCGRRQVVRIFDVLGQPAQCGARASRRRSGRLGTGPRRLGPIRPPVAAETRQP